MFYYQRKMNISKWNELLVEYRSIPELARLIKIAIIWEKHKYWLEEKIQRGVFDTHNFRMLLFLSTTLMREFAGLIERWGGEDVAKKMKEEFKDVLTILEKQKDKLISEIGALITKGGRSGLINHYLARLDDVIYSHIYLTLLDTLEWRDRKVKKHIINIVGNKLGVIPSKELIKEEGEE